MSAAESIRAQLERQGRSEVVARDLLGGWSGEAPDEVDRAAVAAELTEAGVGVDPPLEFVSDLDSTLVLRLEDPAVLRRRAYARQAAMLDAAYEGRAVSAPSAPASVPAAKFDLETLHRPLLAVGLFVVIVALFLPWYSGSVSNVEVPEDLSSGWEWLELLDVFLAVVCAGAFALVLAPSGGPQGGRRWLGRVVFGLAALALILVTYRIVSPPDDALTGRSLEVERDFGAYVCLLGVAAIVAGALAAAAPEGALEGSGPQEPEPGPG